MNGTILVTGATGSIGRHLIAELAATSAPAAALVRVVGAARVVQDVGIEARLGSFDDTESLRGALAGIERIFLLTPPGVQSMIDPRLCVIETAMAAGVTQVVKLSSIAADEATGPSIVAAHREVELEIERTDMAWTHLRPNWFMQNELANADDVAGAACSVPPMSARSRWSTPETVRAWRAECSPPAATTVLRRLRNRPSRRVLGYASHLWRLT